MAAASAEPHPEDGDEDYKSSEDEDFAPEDNDIESSASEAEDGATAAGKKGRGKRKPKDEEAEDIGFENSGDEAIARKGKRKRVDKDDEGGEGLFVKTRTMRAVE